MMILKQTKGTYSLFHDSKTGKAEVYKYKVMLIFKGTYAKCEQQFLNLVARIGW